MKRSVLVWSLLAAIVLAAPVTWRVLSWERSGPPPAVDRDMARAGEVLFKHEWQPNDPLSPGGDGLGPVFNARSCVACHHQKGPGGGGGVEHNVTTYQVLPVTGNGTPRSGVIHAQATAEQYRETLALIDARLPAISQPSLAQLTQLASVNNRDCQAPILPSNIRLSQRNTPALFGAGLIDSIPDRVILAHERAQRLAHGMASSDGQVRPVGRAHRLPDGKIGRFGWKAQTAHLADFVVAACANELGLGNPREKQPKSLAFPNYAAPGLDLTQQQCDQLTAFIAALPRPVEHQAAQADLAPRAAAGKALFQTIGCAACHTPNLGSVEGMYSDLLLHRMGDALEGGGSSYGGSPLPVASDLSAPLPDEWRTPPLWGVADSGPYLHDGRAATLQQAIELHGGQGAAAANRFKGLLSERERGEVLAFLQTLRAP